MDIVRLTSISIAAAYANGYYGSNRSILLASGFAGESMPTNKRRRLSPPEWDNGGHASVSTQTQRQDAAADVRSTSYGQHNHALDAAGSLGASYYPSSKRLPAISYEATSRFASQPHAQVDNSCRALGERKAVGLWHNTIGNAPQGVDSTSLPSITYSALPDPTTGQRTIYDQQDPRTYTSHWSSINTGPASLVFPKAIDYPTNTSTEVMPYFAAPADMPREVYEGSSLSASVSTLSVEDADMQLKLRSLPILEDLVSAARGDSRSNSTILAYQMLTVRFARPLDSSTPSHELHQSAFRPFSAIPLARG